jgi:hypothetical protein
MVEKRVKPLQKKRCPDPSPGWIERVDCLFERQSTDFDFLYDVGADSLISEQGEMILAHKGEFLVAGCGVIAHGRRANGIRAYTIPTRE